MNKPFCNAVSISPSSTATKGVVTITVDVIDKEIVFGTAYYKATGNNEIYSGEDVGII